jgi:hypothetical protein
MHPRQHHSSNTAPNNFTDNAPMSAVMKALKRAMAGEYSRELSTSVRGQCRLVTSVTGKAAPPATACNDNS